MGKRKSFPKDSLDPIELRNWGLLRARFPQYGKFWEKFIGVKLIGQDLHPYGLRFPRRMPPSDCAQATRNYEALARSHYSLFLDFVGANYQIGVLEQALTIKNEADRQLAVLEAFFAFYHHIGTARYMLEDGVRGRLVAFSRIASLKTSCRGLDLSVPSVSELFTQGPAKKFSRDWSRFRDAVKNLRDLQTHSFRERLRPAQGTYYVPLAQGRGTYQEVRAKLRADLVASERVANQADRAFGNAFAKLLRHTKIRIDY